MLKHVRQPIAVASGFDLLDYLEGRTIATGIFEDRFGRERRSFTVELTGMRKDGGLEVTENFTYGDGASETRIWHFRVATQGRFTGHCSDLAGVAEGRNGDGRSTMDYLIRLAMGKRKLTLRFADLFVPIDATTVLNRATVSKWGIRLGQTLIVFRKYPEP